jgi:ketosteroid isomerase-like protein
MKKTYRMLAIAIALAACAVAVRSGEEDARAAIRKADIAFSKATVERRLDGFRDFIAADVAAIRPNLPIVRGKKAFVENWAHNLEDPARTLAWQPLLVEVSKSGDLGYSIGSYELKKTDASGTQVIGTGKYMTVWRKQKDGSWKVVFDTGVQDQPPQPSKP